MMCLCATLVLESSVYFYNNTVRNNTFSQTHMKSAIPQEVTELVSQGKMPASPPSPASPEKVKLTKVKVVALKDAAAGSAHTAAPISSRRTPRGTGVPPSAGHRFSASEGGVPAPVPARKTNLARKGRCFTKFHVLPCSSTITLCRPSSSSSSSSSQFRAN